MQIACNPTTSASLGKASLCCSSNSYFTEITSLSQGAHVLRCMPSDTLVLRSYQGSRGFWHCAPHPSVVTQGGHLVLKSQRQQAFSYTLQVTEHILRCAVRWNGERGRNGQQPFSLKSKELGGAPTNEVVSDVTGNRGAERISALRYKVRELLVFVAYTWWANAPTGACDTCSTSLETAKRFMGYIGDILGQFKRHGKLL